MKPSFTGRKVMANEKCFGDYVACTCGRDSYGIHLVTCKKSGLVSKPKPSITQLETPQQPSIIEQRMSALHGMDLYGDPKRRSTGLASAVEEGRYR
jgi:hypothetical protein